MQIPKLKVLVEAGTVRAVEAAYRPEAAGWTVQVTYARHRSARDAAAPDPAPNPSLTRHPIKLLIIKKKYILWHYIS